MLPELFHPLIRNWFQTRFGEPTDAQRLGWPSIASGQHTLIAAPTGSGKTLAAFLVCLDRLFREWLAGTLPPGVSVVYISPLKALSNDIQRNLEQPLAEIAHAAFAAGYGELPIRAAVRTGDTPTAHRAAMLKKPPQILVTTPESLYLLLTSPKSRDLLKTCRTVIVDEIHALARDKRGSHLALTLERLAAICPQPLTRIGLSATQKPIEEIAAFLVGSIAPDGFETADAPKPTAPNCQIVNVGHSRTLDLGLEVPASQLQAVCSAEQWAEVYERLTQLIQTHRSTLIFVNTRRLAERVSHKLTELLGADAVASHHGSLSRQIRLDAEQRLKTGQLKAIVATASLEMGIDIGYIDLVCQIGSPRSIATFLQRVGRSGHSVGALPKGRLFPLTRDELLECLALVRAVRTGELDRIEIPQAPLDILAQQIIATTACEDQDEEVLFALCQRAWPYRNLSREDFENVLRLVSDGIKPGNKAGTYIQRDQINRRLHARRGARLAAITSGGAIPEQGEFRVLVEGEGTLVGTVDEDFAIDSSAGNIFLLGNTSWLIKKITTGEVIVVDAGGAPPTIPHWFGEAPGRTIELSQELSRLRSEIGDRITGNLLAADEAEDSEEKLASPDLLAWLHQQCAADPWAAEQAARYVAAQKAAVGFIPTHQEILFERFFDESGGMQLVIHAPFGTRINRAWGLALRKRFCRSFDFELQAAADDNGVLLSMSPQHSFPIESLFKMLTPQNGQDLLEQALIAAPMFPIRWRWNITRALAVLRMQSGKKVPPFLQKFRSEDLLSAAFPETVGCLENHHGPVEIPNTPLVRQTMHDCLHEAMDLTRWLTLLAEIQSGQIKLIPLETREPSPFSHQLLNAQPYAFLDDAGLEERRTRAITTRRSLAIDDVKNLSQLDPEVIAQVTSEAWPFVRDADELHDALQTLVVVDPAEGVDWEVTFKQLVKAGRATTAKLADGKSFWLAAERIPLVQAVYPAAKFQSDVKLPPELQKTWEPVEGRVEIARGRIQHAGPTTASALAEKLALTSGQLSAALEALEGSGLVMRGRYAPTAGDEIQWCERRLLARIHRMTLDGLRRRIQPVPPEVYLDFLVRHHRLVDRSPVTGPGDLRRALAQLQGFELPGGAWEEKVLALRVENYDPQWLDQLFMAGEAMWGRLRPPKRDDKEGPGMAALSRAMPISLLLREDLPWLLPPERLQVEEFASGTARDVLGVLATRGALFYQELKSLTGLLPTHLEDALRELAALGLVSSDTFGAVRAIVATGHRSDRKRRVVIRSTATAAAPPRGTAPAGRWSRFPGFVESPTDRGQVIERWCRLLLDRYGVVFKDLLSRETAAPSWYELVNHLRRLELRGEVRGGRFVSGVAGEQFALEGVVAKLRDLRDAPDDGTWALLSAADPLNLTGILGGERVSALHTNWLVMQRGRVVATKVSNQITFLAKLSGELQVVIRRALQLGRKPLEKLETAAAQPRLPKRSNTPSEPDPTQLNSRRRMGW